MAADAVGGEEAEAVALGVAKKRAVSWLPLPDICLQRSIWRGVGTSLSHGCCSSCEAVTRLSGSKRTQHARKSHKSEDHLFSLLSSSGGGLFEIKSTNSQ